MTLKTVKIIPARTHVTLKGATKEETYHGFSGELQAISAALSKIAFPCKVEICSNHEILKRLLPEITKSVHNTSEICEGGYDKYQVMGLLILMKKIKNISLTDR